MNGVLIDLSCFIHEIPLSVYHIVCVQLDQNERWKRLALNIGYNSMEIEKMRQSNSPTTELLTQWSNKNHTVTELFMALHQIGEIRIMEHLLELVDRTFHRLVHGSTKLSTISSTKSQNSSNGRRRHTKKSMIDTFKSKLNLMESKCYGIPKIAFTELATATNEWENEKILGAGSYGTVYRGKWKFTEVAIKRFNANSYSIDQCNTTKSLLRQIVIEMRYLNKHRHDNILPLYGYSFDGTTPCLVYQMMANGSLDQRLQQKKLRLTYKQRLNIAIGTAKGLEFLHTFDKKPTVHGDIKSANILLDSNLNPKIGDFGLAHQTNGTTKSKRIYGTRAYMPDDFFETLVISTKNDTFSFGVVLFELATSLKPHDCQRDGSDLLARYMWNFKDRSDKLNELVDECERRHSTKALPILKKLIKIGFYCTKLRAIERPEMSEVLNSLLTIV